MSSVPASSTSAATVPAGFAVHVDHEVCDGCGICVYFCKPAVFALSREIGRRGVFPAQAIRAEACNGCRLCELGCPQLAILIASSGERWR
jgi:2-oxoglutarate ferredoxin oxidoreductase subunit delta